MDLPAVTTPNRAPAEASTNAPERKPKAKKPLPPPTKRRRLNFDEAPGK